MQEPEMQESGHVRRGAILDTWAEEPWTDGVQIDRMEELGSLAVRTMNHQYEITILCGRTGEVLVRGGTYFPEFTPVILSGASLGGSFLKMRGIYVGFCMEINANGERIITTPVQTIAVLM